MGRNGHRAGAKHRGGRRGGGRGQPQHKPRAPDGGGDNPNAAPDPPSPADGVREVHKHDEPGGDRLGARPEPDHGDGGERPELPPPEPRHRRDAPDGREPPGPRRRDARVHSRYAFAARPQDGPEAKQGQRRAGKPVGRNSFWSPDPDELLGLERRKLEPKPEGKRHDDTAAGDPLGHGAVGDPPRRGHRSPQPEPPHGPLGNHNAAEAQHAAEHGHGGHGGTLGSVVGAERHTGSAAGSSQHWPRGPGPANTITGPGAPRQWPRNQKIRTTWPGAPPIGWPQWPPPEGPLVPWNTARWNPPSPTTAAWPEPCSRNREWNQQPAPDYRRTRGGGNGRTAAPWPGRGRRQFGPGAAPCPAEWRRSHPGAVPWRQQSPAGTGQECRAAWDNAWKNFIRCSADPIEVARCLQVGTEADWGTLYAQFVCTAPRTAAAPPFDPHASRIGKATAARFTAQF